MAAADSSSSSRPSLAVIVACSIVGGLVGLLALYRLILYIHRRRILKSLPLPPIQPLAHHREKYMPTLSSSLRVPTEHSHLRPSSSQPSLAASSTAPLISPSSAPSLHDLSLPSGHLLEENSNLHSMQDMPLTPLSAEPLETDQLVPPNPAFAAHAPSPNSSRSASPLTASSSQSAEESDGGALGRGRRSTQEQRVRVTSSSRRPRRHSATPSTLSAFTNNTVHTTRSSRSISTIRGAPHLPHNRIEIVLPAPLAPESHPYGYNISHPTRPSVDFSFTRDTWLPTASRSSDSPSSSSNTRSRRRPSEPVAGKPVFPFSSQLELTSIF